MSRSGACLANSDRAVLRSSIWSSDSRVVLLIRVPFLSGCGADALLQLPEQSRGGACEEIGQDMGPVAQEIRRHRFDQACQGRVVRPEGLTRPQETQRPGRAGDLAEAPDDRFG